MLKWIVLFGVVVSIYISPAVRSGTRIFYTVTATKHWELETAARFYATRIIKDGTDRYHLEVPQKNRLFGLSLEANVPAPNPRLDPRNQSRDREGGRAGDGTRSSYGTGFSTIQPPGTPLPMGGNFGGTTASYIINFYQNQDERKSSSSGTREVRLVGSGIKR